MSFELYNSVLRNVLQSNVNFTINGKVIKSGVVKLFTTKQYFIRFHIDIPGKDIKVYEVPYPYDIHYDEISRTCCLNYKLSSLCNNHAETMHMLRRHTPARTHKLYDSMLEITSLL